MVLRLYFEERIEAEIGAGPEGDKEMTDRIKDIVDEEKKFFK